MLCTDPYIDPRSPAIEAQWLLAAIIKRGPTETTFVSDAEIDAVRQGPPVHIHIHDRADGYDLELR